MATSDDVLEGALDAGAERLGRAGHVAAAAARHVAAAAAARVTDREVLPLLS